VGGLLHLDTGALTAKEINLLLTDLPVDITYVDADDTVRFFSQTKERIFPRSPAIIGRKVQKCHPPASVHRVQRIVDDFRAGRRDEAGFWIQMQPAGGGEKFIHIRYFAIRDEQGTYQGTLEVSQDVTSIRALEGERRLLDEGE
jgi:PAS domain S-box-containing protein